MQSQAVCCLVGVASALLIGCSNSATDPARNIGTPHITTDTVSWTQVELSNSNNPYDSVGLMHDIFMDVSVAASFPDTVISTAVLSNAWSDYIWNSFSHANMTHSQISDSVLAILADTNNY